MKSRTIVCLLALGILLVCASIAASIILYIYLTKSEKDSDPSIAPLIVLIYGCGLSLFIPLIICCAWRKSRNARLRDAALLQATEQLAAVRLSEQEALLKLQNERRIAETKTQFMANVSHEVRTPLNAINAMADFMAETALTTIQQSYLSTIKSSVITLLSMLTTVLDYNMIAHGNVTLNATVFDLCETIRQTKDKWESQARESGNDFSCDIHIDCPFYMNGDFLRLTQVLDALLSNANKFTQHGNFSLQCDTEDEHVTFVIQDSGIGMSTDQLQLAFEPFYQRDISNTRRFSGIGIGLTFTEKLVTAMGGSLHVQSIVNDGTTVTVRIPFTQGSSFLKLDETSEAVRQWIQDNDPPDDPPENILAHPLASSSRLDPSTKTVLIVDDNAINLKVAQKMVKSFGYDTLIAHDGQEAIDMYSSTHVDIILMDGQMPVKDGYEATQELREKGATLPIICLTANVLPGEKERVSKFGMTDLLEKPVDKNMLEKMLSYYLSRDVLLNKVI